MTSHGPDEPRSTPRAAASIALAALLLGATIGEGGATADALLALHAAIVAAWVAIVLARVPVRPPGSAAWTGLVAYAAVAVVSGALAPYGYAAFLQAQEIAAFLSVVVFASTLGSRWIERAAAPLAIGAALHGGWAIGSWLVAGRSRPAGTFLNPNHLAAWLVAVGLVVLTSRPATRAGRMARVAGIVGSLAGLVATASRGAMLGLAAGGAAWIVLRWPTLGRTARRTAVGAAAVVAVLAAGVVGTRLAERDAFAFHRVSIWGAAAATALEAPVLGVGPGQFPAAAKAHLFPDGDPPMRFDRRFAGTHSDWLRPWVETGALGAAVLAVTIAAGVGTVRRRRRDGALGGAAVGALAALVALAVQAGVDNLSDRPAIVLLVAALAGAVLSGDRAARPVGARSLGLRAGFAAGLVALFAIGDAGPWLAARSERRAATTADARGRIDALTEAIGHNPAQPFYRARLADALVLAGPLDTSRYVRARESAEAAVRLQPADAEIVRSLARVEVAGCLGLFRDVGSANRALAAYRAAAELAPFDATLALETADFLRQVGRLDEALAEIRRALDLEPEAVAPRVVLAEIERARGDLPAARGALVEAETIGARWAGRSWDNAYTRTLMRSDPARIRRLRDGIPAASGGVGGTTAFDP